MTVKIVPTTKDVIKAFTLRLLEEGDFYSYCHGAYYRKQENVNIRRISIYKQNYSVLFACTSHAMTVHSSISLLSID